MARLLQLTDLHVVAQGALMSGVLDTRALLRRAVDTLIARLPAIGPVDAILLTGDVSDDGSAESYAYARVELARLGLPLLAVPGNHDRREAFRAGFADLAFMPGSDRLDWVSRIGDATVIGLDSLVEGEGGGRLSAASLDRVSEVLGQAGVEPVVIAVHHPPLRTGIQFMDAITLANADALAGRIAGFAGRLWILSGHVHGLYHGWLGGHPVSTALSVCSAFALDRRGNAPVGFMTAPTGAALLDTESGLLCMLPLDHGDGPFSF